MSDQQILAGYVDIWWHAVADFVALLEELPAQEWSTPTDLAGWDVRAVAAHTAHLERVLATGVEEEAEVGQPPHVTAVMGLYTEIGVVNRRDVEPAAIIAEIREATTQRHDALTQNPPTDASAPADNVFGAMPWTWSTLLRNRPLDIWMHEQDVRRAVGRPGNLDSAAAAHTAQYLADGFGFVLGKKTQAAPGTTALLAIEGQAPQPWTVDANGRGVPLEMPADPHDGHYDVALHMDRETYVVLAGGRRPAAPGKVTIDGDQGLGEKILARMATTP